MYIFSFEKLEVWKEAVKLSKKTYSVIENFPDSEEFGLTNQ
ncbi:four helix bundle protein [Tenacibaculum sp. 1B UA]|nr:MULTISPECIES: four helix bundle protein [unclassified Tenacibaculum]MDO6674332.1 four helix bundle protein [Tenacibaculum sp. 1_MG-2023]MDX8552083.1 four helix bundle protein [Tenacibaculum sp. 1B UA]